MKEVPIQAENEGHPFLRVCCVCGWRFFTGSHMDGKYRSHRNGSVLPRYRDYYWNRYSRPKRALIRNLCFWVLVGVLYGWRTDWPDTKFAVFSVIPFLGWRGWVKLVNVFTMQTRFTDSDQHEEVYRIMRPVWRKRIARLRPPKVRWKLPDGGVVDPQIARTVLAENAEDGGAPITSLRRAETVSEELSGPQSTRVLTIMRNYRRKEGRI